MDTNQLHELATNARLNHWPPHLGVKTDAEKIEYLAQQLMEAADMATTNEELIGEVNSLRDEIGEIESDFETKIQSLKDDLEDLKDKIEEDE